MPARFLGLVLATVGVLGSSACGDYPAGLADKSDVAKTPVQKERIAIPFLPIEDYAALSKFRDLVQISLFSVDGTGGTDAKLEALSKLELPKLVDLDLLNSPQITDAGFKHLARIKSLRMMQLEGTSISDASLRTVVEEMNITGINVANCPKVTFTGMKKLLSSKSLTELGIGADYLTQKQVIQLIEGAPKSLEHFAVVDLKRKLDGQVLEKAAAKRGFTFVLRESGAMQDMEVGPKP
jgi:hypothetical protein